MVCQGLEMIHKGEKAFAMQRAAGIVPGEGMAGILAEVRKLWMCLWC